jgi:diguanylate cyclase (GGDEF)-like protein
VVAYAGGKSSELLKSLRLEMGKGISGWVVAYKRAIMNTAPALDFQNSDPGNHSFADSLVVPLIFEGNCIGTISLYSETARNFSQEHLDLLQTAATMISSLIVELQKQRREGKNERLKDPVTRVYRAEYLSVAGTQMLNVAESGNSPLSLLAVQIVNLSQITSLYGMNAGDVIMQRIAENLRSELREMDILVRYGHEGFVALLPGVRREQASRYARRLQHQIRTSASIQSLGRSFQINCQTAVASFPADGASIFALLQSSQHNLQEQGSPGVAQSADGNLLEFPRL